MTYLALDLFCGPGGVARTLQDHGFEVVGFDTEPQPEYPGEFRKFDLDRSFEQIRQWHGDWAFSWASPPCQFATSMTTEQSGTNLIPEAREYLRRHSENWVIENVPGAMQYLYRPALLCGSMFDYKVRKHRVFEISGVPMEDMECTHWQAEDLQPEHEGCMKFPYDHAIGDDRESPVQSFRESHGYGNSELSAKQIRKTVPRDYVEFWLCWFDLIEPEAAQFPEMRLLLETIRRRRDTYQGELL